MTKRRITDDSGSVLLLGLGLIGVVLLALSVAVDASLAFVQRSVLQARADSAVLAGAQAIDLDAYYAHGATSATRLVPHVARNRTLEHLLRTQQVEEIRGLEVVSVSATDALVEAVLRIPIRTAFWPIDASISVKAAAQLDYVG